MNLDETLKWIIDHNVFLIELLFLAIGGTVSFVLFRSVTSGKDDDSTNIYEIERTLRKILDKTTSTPTVEVEKASSGIKDSDSVMPTAPTSLNASSAPAAASPGATGSGGGLTPEQLAVQRAELENLKQELQKRDSTLKDLQKSLDDVRASGSGAAATAGIDTKAMEDKIKELQAKLAEYEIIEDDIANLSTYKTENSKLKSELDGLKTKLSTKLEETGNTSDNVKQFAALVGAETPQTVPGGMPAGNPLGAGGDAPATPPPAGADAAPPPPPKVTPVPAAAPTAQTKPESAAPPKTDPTINVKSVDEALEGEPEVVIDPGAAEFTGGDVTVKEAGSPAAEDAFGNLDTEKLLAETKDLPDSAPAAAGEDGDQGEKLINEFENFMKGG